jgi:hypothetical protein
MMRLLILYTFVSYQFGSLLSSWRSVWSLEIDWPETSNDNVILTEGMELNKATLHLKPSSYDAVQSSLEIWMQSF